MPVVDADTGCRLLQTEDQRRGYTAVRMRAQSFEKINSDNFAGLLLDKSKVGFFFQKSPRKIFKTEVMHRDGMTLVCCC